MRTPPAALPIEGELPSLDGATGWLNSPPLTAAGRRALRDRGVGYPVATDNDYAIWHAFGNLYWPALYFADAQGRIRHHQFGEGDYEESELIIQQVLASGLSAGADPPARSVVSVAAQGVEAPADWADLESPENYAGLHLVMGPAEAAARFRVLLDGQPPGPDHGLDVDGQGTGTVTQQRLYQLIRQQGPVGERTFEVTFLDPGVQAYSFTFG